jgi:hypothetical protein
VNRGLPVGQREIAATSADSDDGDGRPFGCANTRSQSCYRVPAEPQAVGLGSLHNTGARTDDVRERIRIMLT